MLITCLYGGVEFKCTDTFVTVLTDEGLCCTFNGVNKRYIAKEQYKSANIHDNSLCVLLKLFVSMRDKHYQNCLFLTSSNTQEFNISDALDATANDWTPERGFASFELKNNILGYPRPVVGSY